MSDRSIFKMNWRPISELPDNTTAIVGRWGDEGWLECLAARYVLGEEHGIFAGKRIWSYGSLVNLRHPSPFGSWDGKILEPDWFHLISEPPPRKTTDV